jgi:hypothetical protein
MHNLLISGYFAIGEWSPEGCLPCFCSGLSNNYSSAPGWNKVTTYTTWSLLNGTSAVDGRWTGVSDDGTPAVVTHPTSIEDNVAEHVMRIPNDGHNLAFEFIYFKAAEAYLGNKRAAYGQNFSFSLAQRVPEGQFSTPYARNPAGDIIIEGTYTNFSLVANLPTLPTQAITTYNVSQPLYHNSFTTCSCFSMSSTRRRGTSIQLQASTPLMYKWLKPSNQSRTSTSLESTLT